MPVLRSGAAAGAHRDAELGGQDGQVGQSGARTRPSHQRGAQGRLWE